MGGGKKKKCETITPATSKSGREFVFYAGLTDGISDWFIIPVREGLGLGAHPFLSPNRPIFVLWTSQSTFEFQKEMSSENIIPGRRFQAIAVSDVNFQTIRDSLESDPLVSFFKWSSDAIYIEITQNKTVAYFRQRKYSSLLSSVRCCGATSIKEEEVDGQSGVQMAKDFLDLESGKPSLLVKMKMVFRHVREAKNSPDLKDHVAFIFSTLNPRPFDQVISAAKLLNVKEECLK